MEHIRQDVVNRLRVSGIVSKNKRYFCHVWKNNCRLFLSVTFNHVIWQRRGEVLVVGGEGRGGGAILPCLCGFSLSFTQKYKCIYFVGESTTPNWPWVWMWTCPNVDALPLSLKVNWDMNQLQNTTAEDWWIDDLFLSVCGCYGGAFSPKLSNTCLILFIYTQFCSVVTLLLLSSRQSRAEVVHAVGCEGCSGSRYTWLMGQAGGAFTRRFVCRGQEWL